MEQPTAAWDNRSNWNNLWEKYLDLVLASDQNNPRQWYENLSDYYDFVSAVLNNTTMYEEKLKDIYELIFVNKNKHGIFTSKEKAARLEQSYWQMRQLLRDINRELYQDGHILPLSRPKNIKRAIDNYYETDKTED